MDFVTYGLFFLAGGLISYIVFAKISKIGEFETMIWAGLKENKRVIVSLDNDAYIFERLGNRIRITKGVVDYLEEQPYENVLDDNSGSESINSDTNVL